MIRKTLWKEQKMFLVIYGFVLSIACCFLFFHTKADLHLAINGAHSAFGDFFFINITHLGDGLTTIVVVIILLFFSYRKSLMIAAPFLAGGLVAQVMKRFIFNDMDRPVRYFADITELHIVEGVKLYGAHSFPSGHTASAFSLFFCLAIFVKNPPAKVVFMLLAVLVAFSRVYLSQHFLADVVAGSLIGMMVVFPFYRWIYASQHKWLDGSLRNFMVKTLTPS
ncbi:MAG: phosphatase PAP2 family protein [Bacteroidales bacterium]|nr:phosphatase PAP2 family protein [Bacteroidales bacterium]MDZ4204341.1 phosphatase PAP2 family protein [Bacteroidales bacterium]